VHLATIRRAEDRERAGEKERGQGQYSAC
jgi:hypothetical protein